MGPDGLQLHPDDRLAHTRRSEPRDRRQSGTITAYDGDDPTCTPHVYTANTPNNQFVDPGDGHVHILRDESGTLATTVAVQLIPSGSPRREDTPLAPGNCGF